MSYGELGILTDTIAGQLQHAGFDLDSRIAVVHRGGAEGLTVVLGVVKRSIAVPLSSVAEGIPLSAPIDAELAPDRRSRAAPVRT